MRLESDRPATNDTARTVAHRVGVLVAPETDFILWHR